MSEIESAQKLELIKKIIEIKHTPETNQTKENGYLNGIINAIKAILEN